MGEADNGLQYLETKKLPCCPRSQGWVKPGDHAAQLEGVVTWEGGVGEGNVLNAEAYTRGCGYSYSMVAMPDVVFVGPVSEGSVEVLFLQIIWCWSWFVFLF